MSYVLPPGVKTNLHFFANYRLHKTYLLKLDRTRFAGLGEDATQAFVRHAMAVGDGYNLQFAEEVQYLMFLMYFLGSNFHEDPRYSVFARILNRPPSAEDHRIMECHEVFADFSKRYLADELSIYSAALERFGKSTQALSEQANPTKFSIDAFFASFEMTSEERSEFPVGQLVRIAEHIRGQLRLSDPFGTAVCLSLSLWMGTGFSSDPLYPWVHDILEKAGQDPGARETALMGYAQKRMKRQISSLQANAKP